MNCVDTSHTIFLAFRIKSSELPVNEHRYALDALIDVMVIRKTPTGYEVDHEEPTVFHMKMCDDGDSFTDAVRCVVYKPREDAPE